VSTNESLGSNCYSTNPLTWKNDTAYASAKLNPGGLPRRFDRIDPGICDAKIQGGLLWIHKPNKRGYFRIGKNYHVCDYNLFYVSIRENAALRIQSFFEKKR